MAKDEQGLKLKILAIAVKENQSTWTLKAKAFLSFKGSKAIYNASLLVDSEHYQNATDKIEKEIKKVEATPDMFDDWKARVSELKQDIKLLDNERKEFIKMEIKNFGINTEAVDYFKNQFVFRISEENILQIIAIRENFDKFVMHLE